MKKLFYVSLSCIVFFAACHKDASITPDNAALLDTLKGNITEDLTLKEGAGYIMDGQVFVTNNATLTIPAGVTIYVKKEADPQKKGSLIVSKGAKLVVDGTAEAPVLFTSDATEKAPGDWGAIVLVGDAPINTKTYHVLGFEKTPETNCGGDNATDRSGEIHYLRIEYCGGINAEKEDEWAVDKASGLCLAAVGTGTQLDHIMVSHSNDDAFQFLGGTVNGSYLVAYNNGDDDYDFDHGYTGKLQFIISYRTTAMQMADRANGIESLNDADASTNGPYTHPIISNATIIGPKGVENTQTNLNQGVYIRKNTRFSIINSIISEYPQGGLMVCNRTRPLLLEKGESLFKYNLIQSDDPARAFTWDQNGQEVDLAKVIADPELTTFATNSTNKNQVLTSIDALQLTEAYTEQAPPNLSLAENSPASSGAVFADTEFSTGFQTVNFRGAVGADNWSGATWLAWQ